MQSKNEKKSSNIAQLWAIARHKPSSLFSTALSMGSLATQYGFSKLAKTRVGNYLSIAQKSNEKIHGDVLIEQIQSLYPEMISLMDKLLATRSGIGVDKLYDELKDEINAIFGKNLPALRLSLNDLVACNTYGLGTLTRERVIKEFLPLLIIVRDIPKFCQSIEEKNIAGMLADIRKSLQLHVAKNFQVEIQNLLEKGGKNTSGMYCAVASDPALVSQLKKIFNALHKAQNALDFLNSLKINPMNGFRVKELLVNKGQDQVRFMTKVIWQLAVKGSTLGDLVDFEHDFNDEETQFIKNIERTIQDVREAQSSLLEVDIPVYQLFGAELQQLGEFIQSLMKFTSSEKRVLLESKFKNAESIAGLAGQYIGRPTGLAISQLDPNKKITDNSFLLENAHLLPSWLSQVTDLIQSYGLAGLSPRDVLNTQDNKNADTQKGKPVSKEDNEKYKRSVEQLFSKLDGIFDRNIFGKASVLYQSSTDLNTFFNEGVTTQTNRVNEAAGAAVVYQLFRLKNDRFASILCQADRMELYLGLAPGVLTKPIMQQLNTIYETLVSYANSVIDLQDGYEDLLELDNTSFLTRRMQNIFQEKNNCEYKRDSSDNALKALNIFITDFPDFNQLISLTPQKREQLALHYQVFKQYVIEYDPRLSVLLDIYLKPDFPPTNIDATGELVISASNMNILSQFKRNGREKLTGLCEKAIGTYQCYVTLADAQLKQIPEQVSGDLYALSLEKAHSVLTINEHSVVTGRVEYKIRKEHQFVSDLMNLDITKSAQLFEYHRMRSSTLKYIHNEIELFTKQLNAKNWFLQPQKINQIIQHYRILQPYLVDTLPNLETIDRDFVHLLLNLPQKDKADSNTKMVIAKIHGFISKLDKLVLQECARSNNRQSLFFDNYTQLQANEVVIFDDKPLTLESELVKRQDKWIRHQRLSRASGAIQTTLYNLIKHSDPVLGLRDLQALTDAVPFSEMENDLDALATPHQVSWFKRMLNVVHYLNNSFTYLESLDRDLLKRNETRYFLKGSLIEGIYQIQPYIELTNAYQTFMELMQEPAGQKFYDTLKNNLNEMQKYWEQIRPLYSVESQIISVNNPDPIQRGGVWYPLLSLFVAPEHLQALSAGKKFGEKEALLTQQKAKETAQYIEGLTKNALNEEYFSLILSSPYILSVFLPKLKNNLDKFRLVTHKVTTSHLLEIQALLQDLLIEADTWEITVGMESGFISSPMKLILDKLFNSFIEPLDISLEERTKLITNDFSFTKRLKANEEKRVAILNKMIKEKPALTEVDTFLKTLESIKLKLENGEEITTTEKASLTDQYWNIYPLLDSQRNKYEISMDQRDKSVTLDVFCNKCLTEKCEDAKEARVPFKDLLYLVKHVNAATKGYWDTLKLERDQLDAQHVWVNKAKDQYRPIVEIKKETPVARVAVPRLNVTTAEQLDQYHEVPLIQPYSEKKEFFLSKAAICKQLFHEFLKHDKLRLSPGNRCQLVETGEILSSSFSGETRIGIENAIRNLKENLAKFGQLKDDELKFSRLITELYQYKTSTDFGSNSFSLASSVDEPNSCAWMVFAPLLIEPSDEAASFESKEQFLHYLKKPRVAFSFKKPSPLDASGLHIAVETANHEMVNAFLSTDKFAYNLDKDKLKACLSLTMDPKTRIVLLRHCPDLLEWIKNDAELKANVLVSVEELKGLWPHWTIEQQKCFLQETASLLWLNFLDDPINQKKVEKILDADFSKLQEKLTNDTSIDSKKYLPQKLLYISSDRQLKYLHTMGSKLDALYPVPRDEHFNKLLASVGYCEKINLKAKRYLLPKEWESSHNELIQALINLPIETSLIIEALQKIEGYVKSPATKLAYQMTLEQVANIAQDKKYQAMSVSAKFVYHLLNILTFGWYGKSPFLPYVNKLTQAVSSVSHANVLTSDLSIILPQVDDYQDYSESLDALYDRKMDVFWGKLPKKYQKIIVEDSTRFSGLLNIINSHSMDLRRFLCALDKDSLSYFNTLEGVKQLIWESPSFNVDMHLPVLVEKMQSYGLNFLQEMPIILDVLLRADIDSIKKIEKFLPGMDNPSFQVKILEVMPTPLKSEHLNRFIDIYHLNATKFSDLMTRLNVTKPELVPVFWEQLTETQWKNWISLNNLPASTKTLLDLMPIPLRINFFSKMLASPHLVEDIYVMSEKTVEIIYPNEVKSIIEKNGGAADSVFNEFISLRKQKSDDFTNKLKILATNFSNVKINVNKIHAKLQLPKAGFFSWARIGAADDFKIETELLLLKTNVSHIEEKYRLLKTSPMWSFPLINDSNRNSIIRINLSIEKLVSIINEFNTMETSEVLKTQLAKLVDVIGNIEDLTIMSISEKEKTPVGMMVSSPSQQVVMLSEKLTNQMDNLSNQFRQLSINHFNNRHKFFTTKTMSSRTQTILMDEMYALFDSLKVLEELLNGEELTDPIKDKLSEALVRLKISHQSIKFTLPALVQLDVNRTKTQSIEAYMLEIEEKIEEQIKMESRSITI